MILQSLWVVWAINTVNFTACQTKSFYCVGDFDNEIIMLSRSEQ